MARGERLAPGGSARVSESTHDRRISVDRCREILGPSFTLTDEDLKALRDELYTLAEIALDTFQEQLNEEQGDEEQRH